MGLLLRVPYPGNELLCCPRVACIFNEWRSVATGHIAGFVRCASLSSSSSENPSLDQHGASAPSLLTERLSFIHETGFFNSFSSNGNNPSTLLSSIEQHIDKLEHVLIQSKEEVCGSDLYTDAVWETQSKYDTLQEEFTRLQASLDLKESGLKALAFEARILKTNLQDAQAQVGSLSLYKEASEARQAEELARLERLSLDSLDILDRHLIVNEAMSNTLERVQQVWESILGLHSSSVSLKLIGILEREASFHFEALVKVTKVQLEQKEQMVQCLSNEALKNKGLQETAKKRLVAFHQSERKVQQLTVQCNALENQLRSKAVLVEDIRKEAFEKTEALRLAAQIKQDLNLCRQQEVQLTQELEKERLHVKDLSRDLMENSRAVKAELALQQAEKGIMDLNRELALLREGIQSRDDVIKLMQEKIDRNIKILQGASEDREAMRKMGSRIHSLEAKLKDFL